MPNVCDSNRSFDPTGEPEAMNSSTTAPRTSSCLGVRATHASRNEESRNRRTQTPLATYRPFRVTRSVPPVSETNPAPASAGRAPSSITPASSVERHPLAGAGGQQQALAGARRGVERLVARAAARRPPSSAAS